MLDSSKIQTAAANGLSLSETSALLGHKLTEEEKTLFNKTRAAMKLKSKAKQKPVLTLETSTNLSLPVPIAKRFTPKEVENAIVKGNGLTANIIKILDTTWQQLNVYYTSHPKAAKLAQDARMRLVDKAEARLDEALDSLDERTRVEVAKYITKTIGKSRGWSDIPAIAQEITEEDGKITIKQIFGIQED